MVPSSTMISLISFRFKTTPKMIIRSLLAAYIYLVLPRNGLHRQPSSIPSLLPMMRMRLLLSRARQYYLPAVTTHQSQLPIARMSSSNLWTTIFYVSQVKHPFLPNWNQSTTICDHSGIPVASSLHRPTSILPRRIFSILSLFYDKLSIRVLWPMEQSSHVSSLS